MNEELKVKSARKYLGMVIVHPDLNEDRLNQLKAQFGELVTRHGGQVLEAVSLGKRKLAYRVKRLWEGSYLEFHVEMAPAGVEALKRAAGLLDSVVRLTIVRETSLSTEPQQPPAEKVGESEI